MGMWTPSTTVGNPSSNSVSVTGTVHPGYNSNGVVSVSVSATGSGAVWACSVTTPTGSVSLGARFLSAGQSWTFQASVTSAREITLSAAGGTPFITYDPRLVPPPNAGSPAANVPVLLPGTEGLPLPNDPVVTAPVRDSVNAYDAANDLLDRSSGERLVDYGDGWELEPALPDQGTPVLYVRHGVNLIRADSVVDIDQSDHAQQVILEYDWPRISPPSDPVGTVYEDGSVAEAFWQVQAVSSPSHGRHSMIVKRSDVPASHALAQITADRLGARAWLRGRTVEVTTTLVAWVRPRDTVQVRLPWSSQDGFYWVASVSHDSTNAESTMTLRQFVLDLYPAED